MGSKEGERKREGEKVEVEGEEGEEMASSEQAIEEVYDMDNYSSSESEIEGDLLLSLFKHKPEAVIYECDTENGVFTSLTSLDMCRVSIWL